ncbi:MATE family efflux transporter [Photobacterium angustum]|uniref:hypothetical protein n=1 Tax=Photobacterium angustum TaxID=661 RepID=UPI000B32EA50|nr:hypothetical protein [Photobacterium angustum]
MQALTIKKKRNLLTLSIVNSVIISIITILLFYFTKYSYLVLIVAIPLSLLYLYASYFRSQLRVNLSVFISEISWYLFSILICLLLFFLSYQNAKNFIFSASISLILVVFVLSFIVYKKERVYKFRFDENISHLKQTAPLILTGFLSVFLSRMDILMLKGYVPDEDIGYYNIISKIATQLLFLYQVIIVFFIPRLSKVFNSLSKKEMAIKHAKLIFLSIVSVLLCYIFYLIFDFYYDVYHIFKIPRNNFEYVFNLIFIYQLVSVCLGYYGYFIIFIKCQKVEFLNVPLTLFIAFLLNSILIPKFGVLGATYATAISVLFINILRVIEYHYLSYKLKSI